MNVTVSFKITNFLIRWLKCNVFKILACHYHQWVIFWYRPLNPIQARYLFQKFNNPPKNDVFGDSIQAGSVSVVTFWRQGFRSRPKADSKSTATRRNDTIIRKWIIKVVFNHIFFEMIHKFLLI
jgi:hypothetical protein